MKKISIIVPCYNEWKSVCELHNRVLNMFENELKQYDFEIIFVDDYSKDNTRDEIRKLCKKDKNHVKAIFNSTNFWFSRNIFSSFQYWKGDVMFLVFWDLQDPPELLPEFIKKWEDWNKIVIWEKIWSEENAIISFCRKTYYNLIWILSETSQIKNFNWFWLYDRSFVEVINQIDDMSPYLKQVIAEYSNNYGVVKYEHKKSSRGKSNFNFYRNYDFAMEWITSSTKKLMRLSTLISSILMIFSIVYACYVFVKKLIYWDSYPIWIASLTIWIFLLWSIILFFIWVLWEYVLSINTKTLRRPRVVIWEKINFD